MYKSIKNILTPVDYIIKTEVAVKKALELADPNPTIHLNILYCQTPTGPGGLLK